MSGGHYDHLAILALVYAHAGRFQDAVKWQTKALADAPEGERAEIAEILELYRNERASKAGQYLQQGNERLGQALKFSGVPRRLLIQEVAKDRDLARLLEHPPVQQLLSDQ